MKYKVYPFSFGLISTHAFLDFIFKIVSLCTFIFGSLKAFNCYKFSWLLKKAMNKMIRINYWYRKKITKSIIKMLK